MRRLVAILIGALAMVPASAAAHARQPVVKLLARYASSAVQRSDASYQPVHVINLDHVPARVVRRAETAVETQINREVHRWWGTPRIYFANAGVPVFLVSPQQMSALKPGDNPDGFHSNNADQPYAVIAWNHDLQDFSAMLSHELIELEVDPQTTNVLSGYAGEVCDPVVDGSYQIGDVDVSDFALPAWFHAGSHGPWDFARYVRSAGNIDMGYIYKLVNGQWVYLNGFTAG